VVGGFHDIEKGGAMSAVPQTTRSTGGLAGDRAYRRISVEASTPVIGAEVSNIDLSSPIDRETFEELNAALIEHKVLFFRDQHNLTPETHVAFGRNWGALTVEPWRARAEGLDDITIIEGYGADRYKESWHADMCYTPEPPKACVLRAVDIPAVGRDTAWANMEAVYDDLSPKMQSFLAGLTAYYDTTAVFGPKSGRGNQSPLEKDLGTVRVEHPVVRTHPESGRKCIFVNRTFTTGIVGMSERESAAILEFLFQQVRDPEYQVRLRWRPSTVAMWDNRSSQHRLIIDIAPGSVKRLLHRVTICGDKPF